ncbi:hypothetical protein WN943_011610 [Citrus x changshan-huyou]
MSSSSDAAARSDSHAPLLRPRDPSVSPNAARPATLALLLGRATGRGHGPSMLVRETAARELEERRADWGYSKPVVALDIMWNSAFVIVSAAMLIITINERPSTRIRLWICGYALQCLVHVVLVWMEYRRRNTRRVRDDEMGGEDVRDVNNDSEDEEEDGIGMMNFGHISYNNNIKELATEDTALLMLCCAWCMDVWVEYKRPQQEENEGVQDAGGPGI